ncbi:MAG: sortase [Bacilli bacterium]|nr:sortase [Bacilli bacterium]
MLNLFKLNNKIKKSHILLIGSFFIFVGIISLSWNYLSTIKRDIYEDMRIAMMEESVVEKEEKVIEDVPIVEEVSKKEDNNSYVIDYSKYLGVLEIPRIGLKRGFYNTDSKYNNIQYNVTMIGGSNLPDVDKGNLILMAHSGDAYISYFAYLWMLGVGDHAYVTYNGRKYDYQVVNIYNVQKNGVAVIRRNKERTTLTLITCTKDNDFSQTIYILELVG